MSEQGSRFVFVDGLRGIAAMSVVLFHAVEGNHITALYAALPLPLALPLRYGNYGVAIFFVLSGFVIAHSLSSKNMTVGAAGCFMLKRSVRLDPPYWFAILLVIGFSTLAGAILTDRPVERYTLPQIVAHVLLSPRRARIRGNKSGLLDTLL